MSSAERTKNDVFQQEALPHMDALYGTALRLARDREEAADLVQDTFVRAYTFFERFTVGTNCRAWLFRIMHNLFINRYRRRVREREALTPARQDLLCDNLVGRASLRAYRNPEPTLHKRLLSEAVVAALDELPDEFRLAVVLADMQDFSYKEIASILDCPVGTVMSRLYRGRRQLRERLLGHAIEQGVLPASAALEPPQRRVGARKG